MKRRIIFGCITAVLFGSFLVLTAFAASDIDLYRECRQCGMDRKAYGYSRMLVQYKDGTQTGTCSLHCVVTDLDSGKGGDVVSIQVADRDTQRLIDAETAVWVMGGKKRGVMTMRPKWAFASREAAQKFVDSYGGKIIVWKDALAAAREDAKQHGH